MQTVNIDWAPSNMENQLQSHDGAYNCHPGPLFDLERARLLAHPRLCRGKRRAEGTLKKEPSKKGFPAAPTMRDVGGCGSHQRGGTSCLGVPLADSRIPG